MDKRLFVILLVSALIQGAYGIDLSLSGGDAGESGSVTTSIDAADVASVNGEITIDGATIMPLISMSGPIPLFEQTNGFTDKTGKSASVYVKVVNALDGFSYNSRVLPEDSADSNQSWVSAEQWLTVPKADYIKCTASASYKTLSAEVGIEEIKGPLTEDYVTLNGYYGKAFASDTLVYAGQTVTDGSANSINVYGQSNDGNGSYSIDTQLNGISGENVIIQWLNSLSSAGNTTQAVQKEHIQGEFTSTASAGSENITRTSNYGTEYDLNMRAFKGRSPTGTVGYYVNPNMTTSNTGAIQGAVNASQSGDSINLYAGIYKENIQIDKSLVVKGSGANRTTVDGNQSGSVFIVGQNDTNASVELSAMTIQGGSGTPRLTEFNDTLPYGGGILNYGKLLVKGTNISGNTANNSNGWYWDGYGGGICNFGILTVINSNISGNTAASAGGGIYNYGGITTVIDSTISGNTASGTGGGIYNEGKLIAASSNISGNTAMTGGGIWNWGNATVIDCVISRNNAIASYPGPLNGGGIFNNANSFLNLTNSTISKNTADRYGGGIFNLGSAIITDCTISGNTAWVSGGGIGNYEAALMVTNSTISGNDAQVGGGIWNYGGTAKSTAIIEGCNISENTANYGGGIANRRLIDPAYVSEATLKVTNSTVSGNIANVYGGGIENTGELTIGGTSQIIDNQAIDGYGGGIFSYEVPNSVTFDGTNVSIKSNKAHLPSPSELSWYKGWGVYTITSIPTTTGGFNPATQVTNNTLI
jgi:hypothetical protein